MPRCILCGSLTGHEPGCPNEDSQGPLDNKPFSIGDDKLETGLPPYKPYEPPEINLKKPDFAKATWKTAGEGLLPEKGDPWKPEPLEPLSKPKTIPGAPIPGPELPRFKGVPDPFTGEIEGLAPADPGGGVFGHRIVESPYGTSFEKIEGEKVVDQSGIQKGTVVQNNNMHIPDWPKHNK